MLAKVWKYLGCGLIALFGACQFLGGLVKAAPVISVNQSQFSAFSTRNQQAHETFGPGGGDVTSAQYNNHSTANHQQFSSLWARPASVQQNLSSYARKRERVTFSNMSLLGNLRLSPTNGSLYTWRVYVDAVQSNVLYANDKLYAANIADTDGNPTIATPTLINHVGSTVNPHSTTPPQVFGNPTGARYPVFTGSDAWRWQRPLEQCGSDPATAIFDGAPGRDALFCNISGGVRSVTYDTDGLNPTSLSPFAVHLFHGSAAVTPLYWSWYTGGESNRIYGTGTESTFTPSVKPAFSAYSSNNYLGVLAAYSTAYGRQYARCGTPISVVRLFKGYSGATGANGQDGQDGTTWNFQVGSVENLAAGGTPYVNYTTISTDTIRVDYGVVRGADGDPGTITKNQILSTIAGTASQDKLILRSNSDDADILLEIKDVSPGNVRLYLTGSGLIYSKDANGKLAWGYDAPNQRLVMSNYSVGSVRKNYTVDRYGQITRYAPNGTTVIQQTYTSGRSLWYNKAGRQVMKLYTSGRLEL